MAITYPNFDYELKYSAGNRTVAGADEAGRGPLAGPVTAAAVILPMGIEIEGLNDSKKLSEKEREELFEIITECAVDYSIVSIDNTVIDKINILKATMLAFETALNKMKAKPGMLLLDGNYSSITCVPVTTLIGGDSKSCSIAAASILAKVTRDRYMRNEAASLYPGYQFGKHKGYATKLHIEKIREYGACPLHRMSFLGRILNNGATQDSLF